MTFTQSAILDYGQLFMLKQSDEEHIEIHGFNCNQAKSLCDDIKSRILKRIDDISLELRSAIEKYLMILMAYSI